MQNNGRAIINTEHSKPTHTQAHIHTSRQDACAQFRNVPLVTINLNHKSRKALNWMVERTYQNITDNAQFNTIIIHIHTRIHTQTQTHLCHEVWAIVLATQHRSPHSLCKRLGQTVHPVIGTADVRLTNLGVCTFAHHPNIHIYFEYILCAVVM